MAPRSGRRSRLRWLNGPRPSRCLWRHVFGFSAAAATTGAGSPVLQVFLIVGRQSLLTLGTALFNSRSSVASGMAAAGLHRLLVCGPREGPASFNFCPIANSRHGLFSSPDPLLISALPRNLGYTLGSFLCFVGMSTFLAQFRLSCFATQLAVSTNARIRGLSWNTGLHTCSRGGGWFW